MMITSNEAPANHLQFIFQYRANNPFDAEYLPADDRPDGVGTTETSRQGYYVIISYETTSIIRYLIMV